MTREELQASIDARNAERDRETSASWRGKVALAEADARPGRYYVTARDGRRTSFLLGPFVQPTLGKSAHARALGEVRRARRYVSANYRDGRGDFFAYGTAWLPLTGAAPVGKLNALIGGGR